MKAEFEKFVRQHKLTEREGEVFACLLRGVTRMSDISRELHLSPSTVSNHFNNIFWKTGTSSKTALLSSFVMLVAKSVQDARLFQKSPRVLVIDDESEICDIVVSALTKRGFFAKSACDPKSAIEIAKYNQFDVVLTDVRMPIVNGYELLETLKLNNRCSPAIIIISGYPGEKSLDEILELGAVAFFSKPIDMDALIDTIIEQYIGLDKDKNRYLRVNEVTPIVIDQALTLSTQNIGYGGLFIPFLQGHEEALRRMPLGKSLQLQFSIEGGPLICATAEVVWKRDKPNDFLFPGIGVKFTSLKNEDEEKIRDFVRMRHIMSFIPIGKTLNKS